MIAKGKHWDAVGSGAASLGHKLNETGILVAGHQAKPRISFMNLVLMIAIFALSAMPAYAQGQQPDTAKLKADAENMVKIITGDKLKIQTYCQILDLDDQIDDAKLDQDTEKATELSEQADELKKKLGPEFSTFADSLKGIDPNSQDGRDIGSIIDKLDEFCGD
jgi:hypothetical protein